MSNSIAFVKPTVTVIVGVDTHKHVPKLLRDAYVFLRGKISKNPKPGHGERMYRHGVLAVEEHPNCGVDLPSSRLRLVDSDRSHTSVKTIIVSSLTLHRVRSSGSVAPFGAAGCFDDRGLVRVKPKHAARMGCFGQAGPAAVCSHLDQDLQEPEDTMPGSCGGDVPCAVEIQRRLGSRLRDHR